MKIIAEIEVEKGWKRVHFLDTLITGEVIEVQVIVGLDQDWDQVPIETELGVKM